MRSLLGLWMVLNGELPNGTVKCKIDGGGWSNEYFDAGMCHNVPFNWLDKNGFNPNEHAIVKRCESIHFECTDVDEMVFNCYARKDCKGEKYAYVAKDGNDAVFKFNCNTGKWCCVGVFCRSPVFKSCFCLCQSCDTEICISLCWSQNHDVINAIYMDSIIIETLVFIYHIIFLTQYYLNIASDTELSKSIFHIHLRRTSLAPKYTDAGPFTLVIPVMDTN